MIVQYFESRCFGCVNEACGFSHIQLHLCQRTAEERFGFAKESCGNSDLDSSPCGGPLLFKKHDGCILRFLHHLTQCDTSDSILANINPSML